MRSDHNLLTIKKASLNCWEQVCRPDGTFSNCVGSSLYCGIRYHAGPVCKMLGIRSGSEDPQFTRSVCLLVGTRPNVSTTPLRQWGFRQCLPFSWTTLKGKHCRHPIVVIGVVDMFGPEDSCELEKQKKYANSWKILPLHEGFARPWPLAARPSILFSSLVFSYYKHILRWKQKWTVSSEGVRTKTQCPF